MAASSLKIEPVGAQTKIKASLRLVENAVITSAAAKINSGTTEQAVPVAWTAFESMTPANCSWLIVVDTSNPARQRTVEACAGEVRSFLKLLPKGDAVMIASLARDLVVAAPFDATPAQLETALAEMKTEGDASFTSLIFQNVKHALADHLSRRSEARKCVVLFTDGKDETPGGPLRVTERRNELIAEAKKLGIPVHTLGFAEKATEANYFADLKELSLQTDGLHVAADVASKQLPQDTWSRVVGAMHSGGTAVLNLEGIKDSAALRLELACEDGRKAVVGIPQDVVSAAVPATMMPIDSTTFALPPWTLWAAAGVVLLLLAMKKRSKKPAVVRQAKDVPAKVAPALEVADEDASAVSLVYLEMLDGGKRHLISAKGVKIGSARHNDIVLKHESVSEDHCSVTLKNGEWVIADSNSVNGLRVNGTYYHQAALSPGDEILLGDVRLRFVG